MQADYEKTKIPAQAADTKEKCGSPVAYEVDWASFKEKAAFENFEYALTQAGGALEEICKDDIGKDAVKKSVKKVKIKNVTDPKAVSTSFKDGVVHVNFNFKEGTGGTTGWTEIQKVVEEAL